jgi:hypothetical protein
MILNSQLSLLQKSRIGLFSAELQLGVAGDDACQNAHLEMGATKGSRSSTLSSSIFARSSIMNGEFHHNANHETGSTGG